MAPRRRPPRRRPRRPRRRRPRRPPRRPGGCTRHSCWATRASRAAPRRGPPRSGVVSTASGSSTPHSGTHFAWLDGYGTTHTDSALPVGDHPGRLTSATLTFYLPINTAETTTSTAYDKLTVKAGSTTLATYSNLNKGAYAQKSFDLSAFKGQTVTISFSGTEDSSLQTSFLIDDTALTVS